MSVDVFNFTTGPATLPDVGELSYNGCIFGPLFETNVSGTAVKDEARRTTKYMEYVITADGFVTLPVGDSDVSPVMDDLRFALTAHAGTLKYKGRGFDLLVDASGVTTFNFAARDVAWGPSPELLDFKPLGGGRSAQVKWSVTVRVVEVAASVTSIKVGGNSPLLQFNCETVVSYDEADFSSMSVRGTMEIPLTRPTQGSRTLISTVDDLRSQLDTRIFSGIDLSRFKVGRRDYNVSRDKRNLEFNIRVDEKPYMDNPPGCTVAHGTYSVRKATAGAGFAMWLCTLRATYTVRADAPRRVAWWAFLAMLRLRMNQSILGFVPGLTGAQDPTAAQVAQRVQIAKDTGSTVPPNSGFRTIWSKQLSKQAGKRPVNAFLVDLSLEEGLYEDSKTVSVSATWRMATSLSTILLASGIWRKLPEKDTAGGNLWGISMKDISGSRSWLPNTLDPALDVIVDFGGG